MLLQVVENRIRADRFEEYIEAAQAFADDAAANDAGCLGMHVLCAPCDRDRVWIVSRWADASSMEASQAFLRHKASLKPAFLGNETMLWEEAAS